MQRCRLISFSNALDRLPEGKVGAVLIVGGEGELVGQEHTQG